MFKQDVDKHLLGVSDPASGQVHWSALLTLLSNLALICFIRMCQAAVWGFCAHFTKTLHQVKNFEYLFQGEWCFRAQRLRDHSFLCSGHVRSRQRVPTVEWVYGQSLEREREVTSLTEAGILWDVLCICSFHNLLSNPSSLQSSTPLQ